jgi:hypothetical protein
MLLRNLRHAAEGTARRFEIRTPLYSLIRNACASSRPENLYPSPGFV